MQHEHEMKLAALRTDLARVTEQLATAQREAAGLREAASAVLDYVIDGVVACHGDKCRQLNCESCYREDDADAYAERARIASNTLRQALTPHRRPDRCLSR